MEDTSKNIMQKIEKEGIKPKAKQNFLLKNYTLWILAILSILLGGLAFSVIVYVVSNDDWTLYGRLNRGLLQFAFVVLPYFWLLITGIFAGILYYNFKNTEFGYRHSLYKIIIGGAAAILLFGGLFSVFGVGERVDDYFFRKIPIYQKMIEARQKVWQEPQEGRLMGVVLERDSNGSIKIIDLNGAGWLVDTRRAKISPPIELMEKMPVRILGKQTSPEKFEAELIKIGLMGKKTPPPNKPFPVMFILKENPDSYRITDR